MEKLAMNGIQYPSRVKFKATKARARHPKRKRLPGEMNKQETRYAEYLDGRNDVAKWDYEAVKFRVGDNGDNCWLTIDFKVTLVRDDMTTWVEYHEVKDFWKSKNRVHIEDDARVKLLAVASKYPEEQIVIVYFHPVEQQWKEERL